QPAGPALGPIPHRPPRAPRRLGTGKPRNPRHRRLRIRVGTAASGRTPARRTARAPPRPRRSRPTWTRIPPSCATSDASLARHGGVVGQPVRPPPLLHLGLVDVPPPLHEPVAHVLLDPAERLVVPVVVLLDDLERPPPRQHVPPDQLPLHRVRQIPVPGLPQQPHGLVELPVRPPGQLMERVQMPPRLLRRLQCLRNPPGRRHDLVGSPLGPPVPHLRPVPRLHLADHEPPLPPAPPTQ